MRISNYKQGGSTRGRRWYIVASITGVIFLGTRSYADIPFTKVIIDPAFEGAWAVYAADLDGDKDQDVLGAASTADDIVWWRNDTPIGLLERLNRPGITRIYKSYPNPFREKTVIGYQLSVSSNVLLEIYDISGRLLRRLIDKHQTPNTYHLSWDGRDEAGIKLASGIYFVQFSAGDHRETHKLVKISR